jgi:membrane protein implicated in regulation of membrane protease activity
MADTGSIAKALILLGAALVVIGAVLALGVKLPWFGKLPGDIIIQKKNITLFFPITTSILISIILSVIFILLRRR